MYVKDHFFFYIHYKRWNFDKILYMLQCVRSRWRHPHGKLVSECWLKGSLNFDWAMSEPCLNSSWIHLPIQFWIWSEIRTFQTIFRHLVQNISVWMLAERQSELWLSYVWTLSELKLNSSVLNLVWNLDFPAHFQTLCSEHKCLNVGWKAVWTLTELCLNLVWTLISEFGLKFGLSRQYSHTAIKMFSQDKELLR